VIYAFEDYELDTLTEELRRDGEVVHVEPQVFGVLAHLIANRDRVVTKIELLDEVWPDRFVSESAITSRLQAARHACGDNGREQRVIRTKHGRGYRFVAPVTERDTLGDPAPPAARSGVDPGRVDEPFPGGIVGRDPELQVLDRAASVALGGSGRLVFVAGEAGIGKTTLVEAAIERAETHPGTRVLRAQCRPHRGHPEPYVSLLDAVSRFVREHGEPAARVLEETAPMWLTQMPSVFDAEKAETLGARILGGTRERMLREGVDLLERLARLPLLIVIEDLHWADSPTIELIEWLTGRLGSCSMLVLATYRPGDNAGGDLESTIARLCLDRVADRIDLTALGEEAIGRLITDRLEVEAVAPELMEQTAARTGGVPLFVNEQIDFWLADGTVAVSDDTATFDRRPDEIPPDVPEGLRFLIESSLERLAGSEIALLEAGAVVGREFPAFAVAAALDRALPEIEDELGALARRGTHITAVGDQSWADGTVSTVFRVVHEIHRQVLYDRISASRRATLHQIVGERLELAYRHHIDAHVTTLLGHFEASGDVVRAVGYLHRSGELAVARSAHREAIDPLQSGLELLHRLPEDEERDRREMEMRTTLSSALVATRGWAEPDIELNYLRALELATRLDAVPEKDIARFGLAGVHELRGEYNRSEELMNEQLSDGSDLAVETLDLLACSTFHQGAHSRSLENAVAALEAWDPETHSIYMARYGEHPGVSSNTWGALSAWYLGQPDRSMEMAERALEWGADNEYALTMARVQLAFLHQFRDEPQPCRYWADETIALADTQGIPFRAAQARILLGWCRAADGDPADGVDQTRSALAEYRITGARIDQPYYLGLLADASLLAGQPHEAISALDEATEMIGTTTRSFFYQPELDRLRALALIALGGESDRAEATELVTRATDTAAARGSIPLEIRALVTCLDHELGDDLATRSARLRSLLAGYVDQPELPDVARATVLLTSRHEDGPDT
jgi:DNA-binding winged helix-turn-helix (wHTH) protein/tetratricopeptide (TPR) repeat protein